MVFMLKNTGLWIIPGGWLLPPDDECRAINCTMTLLKLNYYMVMKYFTYQKLTLRLFSKNNKPKRLVDMRRSQTLAPDYLMMNGGWATPLWRHSSHNSLRESSLLKRYSRFFYKHYLFDGTDLKKSPITISVKVGLGHNRSKCCNLIGFKLFLKTAWATLT